MSGNEATANLKLLLRDLPRNFKNDYNEAASNELIKSLFYILTGGSQTNLKLLFKDRIPEPEVRWNLREAQGAEDGAEYTEAARGRPCGHIFSEGEATYYCKTCTADDTCVLCTRCFEASHHDGHQVTVSFSHGLSGCCDCGDPEAWKRSVDCSIHLLHHGHGEETRQAGAAIGVPDHFKASIRAAIGGALDYICDVFSCSPEQMRTPKKEEDIREDEIRSRLTPWYGRSSEPEQDNEFVLVLWNDEKHTVDEVEEQVARAARRTRTYGYQCAKQVDDVGRCIVSRSRNVADLVQQANVLRQIKVTVTIRSSRDTFREQMCATIIEWLNDIAGCSVGDDHSVLMNTVCEELLQPWRVGSNAFNLGIAQGGFVDQEKTDNRLTEQRTRLTSLMMQRRMRAWQRQARQEREQMQATAAEAAANDADMDDSEGIDGEEDEGEEDEEEDMDLDDGDFIFTVNEGATEAAITTIERIMGNPPGMAQPSNVPSDESDDEGDHLFVQQTNPDNLFTAVPRLRRAPAPLPHPPPPSYWMTGPSTSQRSTDPREDMNTRVRVDHLVFYDMRMWKTLRNSLRHFYISTVVTVPNFKRTLSLRFAALYTHLAQLYLVADREHDHSIIYLSLQMLTTPSIAEEVVVQSNFFTRLLAILYTFSTKRQVGEPQNVDPTAIISSDASNLSNRRFYHVFHDMKYLLEVEAVREHIRTTPEYMLQFLDFSKLFQGICPNTRAVREHVEFESEAWAHVSTLIREITRLTRQFCDCFRWSRVEDPTYILRAIRQAAKAATINSIGMESDRFRTSDVKDDLIFISKPGFEYTSGDDPCHDFIPKFEVARESMSVWHSLHYILSWLIDAGKSMSADQLKSLLRFERHQLQHQDPRLTQRMGTRAWSTDECLMAMFDVPLRVCAWLAQVRAGMWVRNGSMMRHQTDYYRGVGQRDVSHQRDLFLIQTAFVICPPSRFLMSAIDRFSMTEWTRGKYIVPDGFEDHQAIDVAEEFLHLLIVVLSDRTLLLPPEEEPNTRIAVAKRDIIHALCFKPLTHSDLAQKLPDKVYELANFEQILDQISTYRPPGGLADSGTLRLRDECFPSIDPYYAYYNKSQREEAETVLRSRIARQTGRPLEEVFHEPTLRPIRSGVFSDIASFSQLPLFAQMIHSFLQYALSAPVVMPGIATTRVEALMQVVLHLVLIAVKEDRSGAFERASNPSFLALVCGEGVAVAGFQKRSILEYIFLLLAEERFKASVPRLRFVLQQIYKAQPVRFEEACARDTTGRMTMVTLIIPNGDAEKDSSAKKREALARQARVMASFKQQQNAFLENQSFDWGDAAMSDSDEDMDGVTPARTKTWEVPGGTCILCQEVTSENKLHGTLAYVSESKFFRHTDLANPEHVREVRGLPLRLDRSLDDLRERSSSATQADTSVDDGRPPDSKQRRLSQGFPPSNIGSGQIFSGCGHVMHFACFQDYWAATCRRHQVQHSRNHAEHISRKEFVCPLCKALGNAFMPTSWQPQAAIDPLTARPENFLDWVKRNTNGAFSQLAYMATGETLKNSIFSADTARRLRPGMLTNAGPDDLMQVANDDGSQTTPMQELMKSQRRLVDTIESNKLAQKPNRTQGPGNLSVLDSYLAALGNSIAVVEIAHRGHASSGVFVDHVSPQILTQLRTVSETITTFASIHAMSSERPFDHASGSTALDCLASICPDDARGTDIAPLFAQDIFVNLTRTSFFIGAASLQEFLQYVRLHYLAEIVKCVLAAVHCGFQIERPGGVTGEDIMMLEHSQDFSALVQRIISTYRAEAPPEAKPISVPVNPNERIGFDLFLYSMMAKYALPFVRKCALLLHVRFGVDFETVSQDFSEHASELDGLSQVLHLPSVDQLLASLGSNQPGSTELNSLIDQWTRHWIHTWRDVDRTISLDLAHPAVYELVALPHTHDTLNAIVVSKRCPTTGGVIQDPVVCLFCGEVFCSQAGCCFLNGEGGCTRHVRKCGGNIGMFFNVRSCVMILKHHKNGSYFAAPYLDKHGETDLGLKRHQQLFLNQNRYDRLFRDVWLGFNGGIPSAVARKIESEMNHGGWESL